MQKALQLLSFSSTNLDKLTKVSLKFRVWEHDMLYALEKTIMAEESGHVNVNAMNIFHDVKLSLIHVTNIFL